MNRGHSVRAVRADNGQVSHAQMLGRTFLDEAHAGNATLVTREAAPHLVKQPTVDFEDDLQAGAAASARTTGPAIFSSASGRSVWFV